MCFIAGRSRSGLQRIKEEFLRQHMRAGLKERGFTVNPLQSAGMSGAGPELNTKDGNKIKTL